MEQVLQAIQNRSSIRQFSGQTVPRDQIETILRAGMAAPSAMNAQPWAFIAIDDRALMDQLADALPYAKMLKSAGAAIVVYGDMTKALPGAMNEFWIQDASAVTQNILLAVEALGLGAVWTGVQGNPPAIDACKKILKTPDTALPFCVIPIGHPVAPATPKDKFKPENIHWNQW